MFPTNGQLTDSSRPGKTLPSLVSIIVRLALSGVIIACIYLTASGYYSHYYLVAAKRGEKSMAQYEQLLQRAVSQDPTNGKARMELARLRFAQKRYDLARSEQQSAMLSYQPLQAFEHLGSITQKAAESAPTEDRARLQAEAKKEFEMAERVRPGNVVALENLMLMAYRSGDDVRLDELSREVKRAQSENVNADYVSALAAERAENYSVAYGKYQRLAGMHALPKGTIFTTSTIALRIAKLRPKLEHLM